MTAWEVVSGTGHRPHHMSAVAGSWLHRETQRIAHKLAVENGTEVGVSGMALGFDLWWAAAVVDAGMKLWAHVPFPQQPDPWKSWDRDEWQRLLGLASEVTYYGDHYEVKYLHMRNDGMREASKAVVAGYREMKTSGGTASAFERAWDAGLPIIHMEPDLQSSRLRNCPHVMKWAAVKAS
jgi:hypothetical protein